MTESNPLLLLDSASEVVRKRFQEYLEDLWEAELRIETHLNELRQERDELEQFAYHAPAAISELDKLIADRQKDLYQATQNTYGWEEELEFFSTYLWLRF